MGRSKFGLLNGSLVANSSQSGLFHSVPGTKVDIKTVPSGGDAPGSRGMPDRSGLSLADFEVSAGSASACVVIGNAGRFVTFPRDPRVRLLVAASAPAPLGVADGIAGVVGSETSAEGNTGKAASSLSPTLEI